MTDTTQSPLAIQWIHDQLAQLNHTVTGPIEQAHKTAWSSLLRVPTSTGILYFKTSSPAFSHEPLLTQALARYDAETIPEILALDHTQQWLLMRDAGITMRSSDIADNIEQWQRFLQRFAQLQQVTIPHTAELLALGCPDRRPSNLPILYTSALSNIPMLLENQKDGLRPGEREHALALLPELITMCEQLASYGIPSTIHHDDFHTGNILIQNNNFRFIDWAESYIAHPFFSLMIPRRFAHFLLKYTPEQLDLLRDAYLRCWTHYAPINQLRDAFTLAERLAKLCRALTWYHFIQFLTPDKLAEYQMDWPYWLQVFLGTEE